MKFLKILVLLGGFIFATAISARASAAAERPSVHGMFVFGETTTYLSHLPMFMAPHDTQALFEVEFNGCGQKAYDAVKGPGALVTLVPEPFALGEMIAHPTSFKATLYQGHFERGGQPIASCVVVKILKVVHAHKLGEQAPTPAKEILFGTAEESYKAHFITAAPDFDQIDLMTPLQTPQGPVAPATIYREDDDLR